jgi:GAF domain-containing protein
MSEFIGTITNQEVNCSIEKNERHIIKLNRHNRFLQILEKIAIQIQNLYYEDKINLSKVFQSIALQISEVLEIDRVEIIQISPGWGQKTWAKVINRETEIDSRLQLPINVDCQEWGYILLESSQSGLVWLDNELSFLNQLGLYIAIAIQQERLKQQWQEEIVQRKEIESTLQEFAIENDQLIPSCDLLGRLKLQQQVSNLQDQKSKLEIENTKSKLLADLTQKIRNSLNLEEILVTTVSELRNSLELDRIVIYKILPGGGGKVITESLVPGYSSVLGFEFPEETLPLLCQRQLSFQPYKAITDVKGEYQTDYPCLVEFLERWCVKSKVIVPIIYDTNVWGFLIVHQCSIINAIRCTIRTTKIIKRNGFST